MAMVCYPQTDMKYLLVALYLVAASFSSVDAGPPTPRHPTQCGSLSIHEVDYDQPGIDTQEFVELTGTPGLGLADYTLVFVNGAQGAPYATQTLTGTMPADGYLVIGSATITNLDIMLGSGGSNLIQNGAPDGFGVWHTPTNTLCDFVNYEGLVGGYDTWPDIGEDTPDTCPSGASTSLARRESTSPPGGWVPGACATPGQPNLGPTAVHLASFGAHALTSSDTHWVLAAFLIVLILIGYISVGGK